MKWHRLVLAFIATVCMIFAGNALAQTDININNANLIRFGGSITVLENQVVENALAFGGNATVSSNAKVVDTAISFGGDVILKKGARVEGDAYSFGGKIVQEPGAIVTGERATFSDSPLETLRERHGMMYGSNSPEERLSQRGRSSFFTQYFLSAIFRISAAVVAAVLGLIILHTSSHFLPSLATKLRQHPDLTALWGIGATVATVFVSVFLAITLIGIPLIPLLSLTVIITSLVGSLGVALFSLDETCQLASKLFGTEIMNEIAGISGSWFSAGSTGTPLNVTFCSDDDAQPPSRYDQGTLFPACLSLCGRRRAATS